MAPAADIPTDLPLIIGPILLGYLFSYGLYGILVVQLYYYQSNFPDDRASIKWLVYSLFFCETFATILGTVAAFDTFARRWGDPVVLIKPSWTFPSLVPVCGFISMVVQNFYCYRIWVLGKNYIAPLAISALAFLQCAMAFYTGVEFTVIDDLRKIGVLKPYICTWLGGSALCDLLIAAGMVYFLFEANSSSSFRNTNTLLNKMITLTVETGMITAFAAILEIILFLAFPDNNLHYVLFLMLAKLYSNTLLATMNARAVLRKVNDTSNPAQLSNRTGVWDDQTGAASRLTHGGVHIATTTELRRDADMVVLDDIQSHHDYQLFDLKKGDSVAM